MILKTNLVGKILQCTAFCCPFNMVMQLGRKGKRVTDTMQVVAGSRIGCFFEGLNVKAAWPLESIWKRLEPLFGKGGMAPLQDESAVSDTELMSNGIYRLYDRPEGPPPNVSRRRGGRERG